MAGDQHEWALWQAIIGQDQDHSGRQSLGRVRILGVCHHWKTVKTSDDIRFLQFWAKQAPMTYDLLLVAQDVKHLLVLIDR